MTKTDRWVLSIVTAFAAVIAVASMETFSEQCAAVRGDSLRLHILANSDSVSDQALKLSVRDALLEQYGTVLGARSSASDAASLARGLTDDIVRTAQKTLAAQGCDDAVAASVTRMYFDTRTYEEGVTLPAGDYMALRIVIGAGAGRNWWCVMYPPLCVPAASERAASDTEARIRSLSDAPAYEARFAVVELVEKIKSRWHGKCR